jgi:Sulfatase-modifying factor enzyme 1
LQVAQHLLFLEGGRAGGYTAPSPDAGHSAASKAHERFMRLPVAMRSDVKTGASHLFAASHAPLLAGKNVSFDVPDGVDLSVWNALHTPNPQDAVLTPTEIWQWGQSLWLGVPPGRSRSSNSGVSLLLVVVVHFGNQLEVEINGRRKVIGFSADKLPIQLHAWKGSNSANIRCQWPGGGFEVAVEKRPSWAQVWRQNSVDLQTGFVSPWGSTEQLSWPPERAEQLVFFNRDVKFDNAYFGTDVYGLFFWIDIKGARQTFRYIEPGTFQMGSADSDQNDERPVHPVTITQGYWLADTPCTQALWMAVMGGKNPSSFSEQRDSPQRPVEQVSWDTVQTFLDRLQALLPDACKAALPTEAEWEYAARAGKQSAYWWGNKADTAKANMASSCEGTTLVKTYDANDWGLFDVHGNVWEWCADAKRPYRDRAEINPSGASKGDLRVVRGGSWPNSAGFARSAYRLDARRDLARLSLGFRLALRSTSPSGGAVVFAGRGRPTSAAGGRHTPAEPGFLENAFERLLKPKQKTQK